MIVYGTDAKEIYNRAITKSESTPVNGVFEYFDMGGAMYRAFKSICGELFIRDFGTFDEAIRYVNEEA
jgi:hypothetical protein